MKGAPEASWQNPDICKERGMEEPVIKRVPPAQKGHLEKMRDAVAARVILYFLSFTGFLVSFMMRTDINLAIVAMVKMPPPVTKNVTEEPQYCFAASDISSDNSTSEVPYQDDGEFDWDPSIQSTILGSFYWCYVLSQLAGGVLVQRFGTKIVFGLSQMATAISSLLIPYAAGFHFGALILLRSIQGVASGFTWPAMYAMIGVWIPPAERSRFMSSFQGFTIGIGLSYPICGFIIAHYGWRVVFYVTGSLGLSWCILWWFLAFDTPQEHPRITKQELAYIQKCTRNIAVDSKSVTVPYWSILTSLPAWAIGVTTFGRIWVHYTFMIPGPLYMKTVLGFSIQKNGLLNGAPFLLSYFSSVIFCYIADILVTRNWFSLTAVRKIFTALSQVVPGFLLLSIGYFGCEISAVLVAWFVAVIFVTAAYAGAMANIVDIAPNFAGPVLAFAQTIHMSASFIAPLVAGFILKNDTTLEQWRKVFGISSVVAVATYIMYQVFGTSEVQSWNYSRNITSQEPEHEPLKRDKSSPGTDVTDV
ncbi:sialin isoform X1 [Halyomorpha halys]|uniref:sialin isoform X1 n=1 Tax=Halyomorpha halys TaxID=286706 RepID=UPI0006D50A74|nr:sialin isoform X2 [Halyomorpha halys]